MASISLQHVCRYLIILFKSVEILGGKGFQFGNITYLLLKDRNLDPTFEPKARLDKYVAMDHVKVHQFGIVLYWQFFVCIKEL
jgi:hypothetical protein